MRQLSDRIDAAVGRYITDSTPGCSILIAQDGNVIFRKAYGLADIEHGIPIRPEDHFIIASNTKQFTCLAVLMLQGRGLLDVDETIEKYFPGLPDYTSRVTIRMLMCHTSGIPDYFERDYEDNTERLRTADTEEMLDIIAGFGDCLEFEPDTAFHYSNSGYVMLGEIVRQVSGMEFGAFIENEILGPLGMGALAPDHMDQRDPKQIRGYVQRGTGAGVDQNGSLPDIDAAADRDVSEEGGSQFEFEAAPYDMLQVGYADGNISASADDILRWHGFLYGSDWTGHEPHGDAAGLSNDVTHLVSDADLTEMRTSHRLKDGSETGYGMGLMIGDLDEDHRQVSALTEIWHTGGTMGFISRISYFPDERISAVMLTNWEGIERDKIFADVMKEALDEILKGRCCS